MPECSEGASLDGGVTSQLIIILQREKQSLEVPQQHGIVKTSYRNTTPLSTIGNCIHQVCPKHLLHPRSFTLIHCGSIVVTNCLTQRKLRCQYIHIRKPCILNILNSDMIPPSLVITRVFSIGQNTFLCTIHESNWIFGIIKLSRLSTELLKVWVRRRDYTNIFVAFLENEKQDQAFHDLSEKNSTLARRRLRNKIIQCSQITCYCHTKIKTIHD